jgi:hypothetical protein
MERRNFMGYCRGMGLVVGFALLLAACGGGGGADGGGGTTPVVYSGNTNPAVATTTNSSKLTANVIGGADAASSIAPGSAVSTNAEQMQGGGLFDVSLRLGRGFRDIAVRTTWTSSSLQGASLQIDNTKPCVGGGTVHQFGTGDDVTFTATVTFVYSNCKISGVTLNGQATVRIDNFILVANVLIPTDFTMSFARLTLRAVGLSVDVGGSLHVQANTTTATLTANLVQLDNSNSLMTKTENLVIVVNIVTPTSFTATVNGRVFDSVHGYVDVTTATPLGFGNSNQPFPDSGQILLTGAPVGTGNRKIRATALLSPPAALPATLVNLELDLDGDSVYEINARLKWTELSSPVGSDLADSDQDGMHNSWEAAYGLKPNDGTDAALDTDMDGTSNINEYLAGTDPSNPSSHP